MYYPQFWSRTLLRFTLYLSAILLVGFLFDHVMLMLISALVVVLIINYLHLYKLTKWLWHSKTMSPPNASGIWHHIYEGIYYLQRRNRAKRKSLGDLVKRFREGSEALPDALVVIDKDARIMWCNRNARIELGLHWPEDKGRRVDNLIRHPSFVDFLHKGDYQYPIEVPAPTNPNKMFEYRMMEYGQDQLLLIARDVSRVSHLEEMRKDFVANVSHELKTPLTVINGYLEVLESTTTDSPPIVGKALSEMGSQTKRMQVLIEDLLILSRIESSSDRIFENVVDMQAMLRQVEIEANALNKIKKHSIKFTIDNDLRVYGVEPELRSACSNLLFNAIHYTPRGGSIEVKFKRKAGGAYFAVIDNGDGIEDKHLRRLTERFYRVDKGRSRTTGGSGLGLSIVKHVLNHHNARLEISSTVGKGSKFSFLLPNELIGDDWEDL
ncbi:two-component system, OmpR family, phosphate regulon sensor histidine kinase PhoR [Glaciecola punicea ACAM 611]|jgi:two-component system phosphate regulon sensor histidine kinase PhoR|uniref:Phosphate regulon sensor protein PhoR n=1 Tax=Glaciecola punicea ACAM 611 TaxID=1121923 RepID=H5T8G4_9ALTE|nr:phosphate regulon sensor histidine kinase PhoR [Glaciecola punicea]OFA30518.1 phosphate regulon sensor histidine kinase PhoR [Glaciecola punicea]GAB54605.1 two-component system, OmpR family, phosphate regulon sensor histidine kinase PhoR [Glaciecola punicea ACAM 611]